ncbi:hypothetical protein ONZ45_g2418 [Pleurotus djamor]|nr:hypothetical protein ONZ45_g2418 [Pleurotus djamor]
MKPEGDNVPKTSRLCRLLQIAQLDEKSLDAFKPPSFTKLATFLSDANSLSEAIHQEDDGEFAIVVMLRIRLISRVEDRIIFRRTRTGGGMEPTRVMDATSKPEITAAPRKYWIKGMLSNGESNAAEETQYHVPWPCMSLAVKVVSQTDPEEQQSQAYPDLLLSSRPDLQATFGLLLTEKHALFLFGIGGFRFDKFLFRWGRPGIQKAMAAMIYALYHPDKLQRPFIKLASYDRDSGTCYYNITFQKAVLWKDAQTVAGDGHGEHEIKCTNFICKAGRSTPSSRCHVFVFQSPNDNNAPPRIHDRPIRVIKSQLVRHSEGQYEPEFLQKVHNPEITPGVVRMTCYAYQPVTVKFPDGDETKRHVLLGLEQEGQSFLRIQTPQVMLLNAYNLLESKTECF